MSNIATSQCTIGKNGCANVSDDMHMSCATVIVTRENGLELSHAIRVRRLKTSQSGVIEVAGIISIAIAVVLDSGVDTSRVAVPNVPVEINNWLAGVDVDKLSIHHHWNTRFIIDQVGPNQFSLNPEGADFTLGGEDAADIIGEEDIVGRVRRDTGYI
jgi:hypothetical protein